MKLTLSTDHSADLLYSDRDADWSRAGALALVEYLDEIDENMELDVCAIRCEFTEYESLQTWAHEFFSNAWQELGFDESEEIDDDEFDEKIRDYVSERAILIEFSGGIIASVF